MKMSNELEKLFNDQITLELEASTVYRQLAIEVDAQDLPGMAAWLRHQADEEIVHANKFIDHLLDRDNHPRIGAISAPKAQQTMTPLDVFTAALEHEQKVSESIRNLYRLAQEEGDIDAMPLLHWFISEQLEEEASVEEIVDQARLVHNDGPGLLRLDAELGSREVESD